MSVEYNFFINDYLREVKNWLMRYSNIALGDDFTRLAISYSTRLETRPYFLFLQELINCDESILSSIPLSKSLWKVETLRKAILQAGDNIPQDLAEPFLPMGLESVLLSLMEKNIYPLSWECAQRILWDRSFYSEESVLIATKWHRAHSLRMEQLSDKKREPLSFHATGNLFGDVQNVHRRSIVVSVTRALVYYRNLFLDAGPVLENTLGLESKLFQRIQNDPYEFYLDRLNRHLPVKLVHVYSWIFHACFPSKRQDFLERFQAELEGENDPNDICSFGILCRLVNSVSGMLEDEEAPIITVSEHEHKRAVFLATIQELIRGDSDETKQEQLLLDMISPHKQELFEFLQQHQQRFLELEMDLEKIFQDTFFLD